MKYNNKVIILKVLELYHHQYFIVIDKIEITKIMSN